MFFFVLIHVYKLKNSKNIAATFIFFEKSFVGMGKVCNFAPHKAIMHAKKCFTMRYALCTLNYALCTIWG